MAESKIPRNDGLQLNLYGGKLEVNYASAFDTLLFDFQSPDGHSYALYLVGANGPAGNKNKIMFYKDSTVIWSK